MQTGRIVMCGTAFSADLTSGFLDRLLGVHRSPTADVVVVGGASVHGLTLTRPLPVVGLDDAHAIVGHDLLRPRRIVRFAGAACVVEFHRADPPACVGLHRCSVELGHG